MVNKTSPRLGIPALVVLFAFSVSCSRNPSVNTANPIEKASLAAIHTFQTVISPVDGDRCFMVPSCSDYGREAIEKHGFFMGWIMTCDRLVRCGHDELYQSDPLIRGGEIYCVDPVENNDFWWYKGTFQ